MIGHNHDGVYALIGHNHDGIYALIVHDHNSLYAPIIHDHPWIIEPPVNVTANGITGSFVAGENLAFGDICYIKPIDGKAWKANATAVATCPGVIMSTGTISANVSGTFLINGIARNDAWSWTINGTLFLSTTAGLMTHTAPTGTDQAQQILGIATNAKRIIFNPQYLYITHV